MGCRCDRTWEPHSRPFGDALAEFIAMKGKRDINGIPVVNKIFQG
jgi:hypothetical protein